MADIAQAALSLPDRQLPQPLGANISEATKAKLKDKSQQFEAYFIQQFISLTRPDLSDDSTMGGGFGERVFAQQMDEQMGKSIAQRGGFGVGDRVYAELLAMQEEQQTHTPINQGDRP